MQSLRGVNILDYKKKFDQRVLPIFYRVNPTDVKYQKNNCAFAMERLESRYGKNSPEVKKWRSALHQISELKNGKCYTADRYVPCNKFYVIPHN